jgi:hypothetical protein
MNKRLRTYRDSNFQIICNFIREKFSRSAVFGLVILLVTLNIPGVLSAQGKLVVHFNHLANGRTLAQDTGRYVNSFNEPYSITKCRYYISNITLQKQIEGAYLIDAFGSNSLAIEVPDGSYNSISFLIGIDSVHNVAGAQSGALDPLNDMFWTWNTGYVTWKLEGFSDSSHADLHRIEQHIGGYRFPYTTSRTVNLTFPQPLVISKNGVSAAINIDCILDEYWNSNVPNRISDQPVVVTPGNKASTLSQNFLKLFRIGSTRNN